MSKKSNQKNIEELLRDVRVTTAIEQSLHIIGERKPLIKPKSNYKYLQELEQPHLELFKLQEWVRLKTEFPLSDIREAKMVEQLFGRVR